ncbi:hypothetical protein ACIQWZ_19975 [Streptomyces sp. NPDC098077]|uniref:hypothetical protein n=1 Tax=Streptomyces sp. NPDC098077 TaxID=3366093 RepID=UPI0037F56C72
MQHIGDAILITEDGTVITVNLPANRENFADYTAALLRCTTLEAFDLTYGVTVWLDEEGLGQWPYNALMDALGNLHGHTNSFHGPVLITGYSTHVQPLATDQAIQLLKELNDAGA